MVPKIKLIVCAALFAVFLFFGVSNAKAATLSIDELLTIIRRLQLQIQILQQQILLMRQNVPAENKCTDGTVYGKCSKTQPKYCDSGTLVDNCAKCGCNRDEDSACSSNGTCQGISSCDDGTFGGQCSQAKPKYCSRGHLTYDCRKCGCPDGSVCNPNGATCSPVGTSLRLEFPNGGDKLVEGETYSIAWKSNGVEKIDIELTDYSCSSETPLTIAKGIPASTGNYSWMVPADFFASLADEDCPKYIYNPYDHKGWRSNDNFKIFIAEVKDYNYYGITSSSASYFKIIKKQIDCTDGTINSKCASSRPRYCDNGALVDDCTKCGCPADGSACSANGTCQGATAQPPAIASLATSTTYDGKVNFTINTNVAAICRYQIDQDAAYSSMTGSMLTDSVGKQHTVFIGSLAAGIHKAYFKCADAVTHTANPQSIDKDFIINSKTCSDGTIYGKCSLDRPLYCENGNLINKCSVCGCPGNGSSCSGNGACQGASECADGTLNGHCSADKPLFCEDGDWVWKCKTCGCPAQKTCGVDGLCN